MSNELRKRGVLLFSFDNQEIQYSKMALECAGRIRHFLDLPVVVVSDKPIGGIETILAKPPSDNPRYYQDYKDNLHFLNGNRCLAYDLSPFEETMVMDIDYVLQSSFLSNIDSGYHGLRIAKRAWFINETEPPSDMQELGPDGLEMWWATLICFNRSLVAQTFFLVWKQILTDYQFYIDSMGLSAGLVRNDFAVTLALNRLFAGSIPSEIDMPLALPTLTNRNQVTSLWPVTFLKGEEKIPIPHIDVHVMHKKSLLEVLNARYP
jgi:hypothetical protein